MGLQRCCRSLWSSSARWKIVLLKPYLFSVTWVIRTQCAQCYRLHPFHEREREREGQNEERFFWLRGGTMKGNGAAYERTEKVLCFPASEKNKESSFLSPSLPLPLPIYTYIYFDFKKSSSLCVLKGLCFWLSNFHRCCQAHWHSFCGEEKWGTHVYIEKYV